MSREICFEETEIEDKSIAPLLDKLFAAPGRLSSKQGNSSLQNSRILAQALHMPHRAYPCIHIAGSNGKGSVSYKIATALQHHGYRVGLYTSPHLIDFRERIRVNAKPIDTTSLKKGLELLFSLDESLQLNATFFELTTHLAFHYFFHQHIDIAVIETGIGGRLDATNIVDPILTLITSISLEHAHLLGDNIQAIASEKAGILKPSIPCVLGPRANIETIKSQAHKLNCPLIFTAEQKGFFDEENSAIARNALMHLKGTFALQDRFIEAGLRVRPACRFEKRGNVLFDVAHNPDAFARLVEALNLFFPDKKKRFVMGLCKDKDSRGCFMHVLPLASHVYLVQASSSRAAAVNDLAHCISQEGFQKYSCYQSVVEGMKRAACDSKLSGELLVVCGSFYIMQEAIESLETE